MKDLDERLAELETKKQDAIAEMNQIEDYKDIIRAHNATVGHSIGAAIDSYFIADWLYENKECICNETIINDLLIYTSNYTMAQATSSIVGAMMNSKKKVKEKKDKEKKDNRKTVNDYAKRDMEHLKKVRNDLTEFGTNTKANELLKIIDDFIDNPLSYYPVKPKIIANNTDLRSFLTSLTIPKNSIQSYLEHFKPLK
jgi:hypothetical protein